MEHVAIGDDTVASVRVMIPAPDPSTLFGSQTPASRPGFGALLHRLTGRDDLGAVEPGRWADLVHLDLTARIEAEEARG